MLNAIWLAFLLLAIGFSLLKVAFGADAGLLSKLMQAAFDASKQGFEISIGLTGIMALWLGIMRVGEAGGWIERLATALGPLFSRLFPGIPPGHPSLGSMTMNMSANALGLDNAATPMGLQAMQQMQTLNPAPQVATNAQILFLVLNASSVTLFPITILMYRAQLGAANPSDVFIPILLATTASSLAGLLAVAWFQKLRLWDRVVMLYLGGLGVLIGGLMAWLMSYPAAQLATVSGAIGNGAMLLLIALFLGTAALKRIDAFDTFIDGAKEGFQVAIRIIPYLVAMLVAIAMLRVSGLLDMLLDGVRYLALTAGWDTRFVDGLPTALMRPLSGSGARAMMIDAMNQHGVDSFAGRLACVIQGSTETTFYVLAVYLGSAGVKHARHAVLCCLISDGAGLAGALAASYWFFG